MALTPCGMTGYYGMGFGWISQIVIFVLFFLVVWWLIKGGATQRVGTTTEKTPQEILKTRLAKGEITKKEYDSLKKDLEK